MFLEIIYMISCILLAFGLSLVVALYFIRQCLKSRKSKLEPRNPSVNVGIFHPYCDACGGGERVLWCAVRSIQSFDISVRALKIFNTMVVDIDEMELPPTKCSHMD